MKRLLRLFVTDSPLSGRRVRDGLLAAVPPAKCLALGTTWRGSLKPLVDAIVDTLAPLSNGFTSGNVLHAEQLAGVIDLGRTWTGSLLSEIRSAVANSSGGATVDVGETLSEAERLDKLLRSAAPTNVIADGLRRLRRAADKVSGARTGDSNALRRLAALTPEQRQSGPNSPANVRSRDFWRVQSAPATSRAIGDNSAARTTAVRDQLAIAARARDTRTRMEALNRAASAFWART